MTFEVDPRPPDPELLVVDAQIRIDARQEAAEIDPRLVTSDFGLGRARNQCQDSPRRYDKDAIDFLTPPGRRPPALALPPALLQIEPRP
jgi:hypothetical protein